MLSLGPRSLGILSVKADFSKAAFGGRRHINVSLLQLQHSYSTVTRKRSKIYSPVTVGTHWLQPYAVRRSITGHLTARSEVSRGAKRTQKPPNFRAPTARS